MDKESSVLRLKLSFNPEKISSHSLRLNMCPNTSIVRKYIPALNKVVRLVVPCGECLFCKHRKQNALIYRVFNHNQSYQHNLFVTLTYNDEHYPHGDDVRLARLDITKFFKRLRYHLDCAGCVGVSYLYCCERGEQKNRLHFHFIIWWNGYVPEKYVKSLIKLSWKAPRRFFKSVSNFNNFSGCSSPIGFTYFGDVNSHSITYVTKYSLKDTGTVFLTWSHGLGLNLLDEVGDEDMISRFRYYGLTYYESEPGVRRVLPVPKYYTDKVYTITEKDFLFKEYLDSDAYTVKLAACNSPDVMSHYRDLYLSYKSRCESKALARTIKRKQKNVLL